MIIQSYQKEVSVTHTFTIVKLIIALILALLGVAVIYPIVFWVAFAITILSAGYILSTFFNNAFDDKFYD
jgi:lipopolysaccharide/colanic/teichoic acid biosynthesis glycosyltransferase